MNTRVLHNRLFRENIPALIGICLCLYFACHVILGHRSVVRLYVLEQQIETLSQKKTEYAAEKAALYKKVTMLRPGSVNTDLLEEQARLVLGYRQAEEIILLGG